MEKRNSFLLVLICSLCKKMPVNFQDRQLGLGESANLDDTGNECQAPNQLNDKMINKNGDND
jgi:hypothetical protein